MSPDNRPQPLPPVVFRGGSPEVLVDHETRTAFGLAHWPDGSMGIHRHDGTTVVISPNGARFARHELGADGWRTRPTLVDGVIGQQAQASDHASGGPVHYDEESGQLLLFYHGETFRDGDPADYYSFIGLAVSDDHGATFTDLGRIITSDVVEGDPDRVGTVELGPGAFVARDGWFFVYFQDRGNGPVRQCLGVARARVADVIADARGRRCPAFTKYFDGAWAQPALGGHSSELLDVPWLVWFDVAVIEPLDAVLLVFSTSWLDGSTPQWLYFGGVSRDGVNWGPVEPLFDVPIADEVIYLTIDSGGPDQRMITGDSFHVYRSRATTPYRWDSAWLERIEVTYEVQGR